MSTDCCDIDTLHLTQEQRDIILAGYPWLLSDARRSYTTDDLRQLLDYKNRRAVYRFIANHGIDTVRLFDRTLRIPRLAIIQALLRCNDLL